MAQKPKKSHFNSSRVLLQRNTHNHPKKKNKIEKRKTIFCIDLKPEKKNK